MYVCICNNVTTRDIEAAVADGACSLECLADALAVSTCCGQCRDFAEEVLADVLASHAPAGVAIA